MKQTSPVENGKSGINMGIDLTLPDIVILHDVRRKLAQVVRFTVLGPGV